MRVEMTIGRLRVGEGAFVRGATRVPRRNACRTASRLRCVSEAAPSSARRTKRTAVVSEVASFAPATVANFGPGFDWLGCAVEVRDPLDFEGVN